MSDGRYIFRNCTPDGNIDIINVQPGEIINREWSFRVNMPPEIQEALDAGEFDPRNIMQGRDGELYDEDGNFLAEVNTFHAQINFNTTDYQPAGSEIVWAVTTGYTMTLTFTETIVRDAMLLKLFSNIRNRRRVPVMNFTGVLRA